MTPPDTRAARIRTVRPKDAAEIVAFTNPIVPTSLATAASFRSLLERHAPPTTERLVATLGDRLVAWCPSGVHDDGLGWFWIGVDPPSRRQGIGSTLYGRLERRLRQLGARGMATQVNDDDGRRFLAARGFARTNVSRVEALDLAAARLEPVAIRGLRVLPLADLDGDTLYGLYAQAREDTPSASPRHRMSRVEYRRDVLEATSLDHEASVVVLRAGEPVAFAFVLSDREGGRAMAEMTGVHRDHRGRGIATLAKLESLRRARDLGVKTMLTENDLENAPMLAVNRKLGFRPMIVLETYERSL